MNGISTGGLITIIAVVAVVCGLISAAIARGKGLPVGAYLALGMVLGLIGVVIAAVAQPATRATQPAGWYLDPWLTGRARWFDGRQWTGYTQPPPTPAD